MFTFHFICWTTKFSASSSEGPFKIFLGSSLDPKLLRPLQTRKHCCGQIVAHDVSWVAQTGKHLLRTQNVSEQNQKHFLCPGHKISVRNKCCVHGQTFVSILFYLFATHNKIHT